jgi:hypothetical protein
MRSGGQRHGDPGGRTAQATDGHRLQDGAAVLPNDAAHGLSALCRSAERPGRQIRRSGVHPGRCDARESGTGAAQSLRGQRVCERIKAVFREIHLQLRQNAAEKAAAAVIACLPEQRCASMLLLLPAEGLVCGVDEAGRGPLAGPVVAAAVILDPGRPISGLNDSKKLSAGKRELLAAEIRGSALAWAVAEASVAEIDRINILQASLLAMQRAVAALAGSSGSGTAPESCTGRRLSLSTAVVFGRSHRRRRRQGRSDCRRIDSRQDLPRCRHARAARQLSAVRF